MIGSPCSMRLLIIIIEIRMRYDGKQKKGGLFLCFYWRVGEGGCGRLLGDDTSNRYETNSTL